MRREPKERIERLGLQTQVSTPIEIGHRNLVEAEITAGVAAGQRVIRYPSNDVSEGSKIRIRTLG